MVKILTLLLVLSLSGWMKPGTASFETKTNAEPITIDGPYVFYRGDSIIVNYIDSADGLLSLRSKQYHISQKDQVQLVVNSDEAGKTFTVKLQPKLIVAKVNYEKPKKMLVISDIEGNFSAFRKLLQGNGVIDSSYNWIFGNGHLALVGDFIDRGTMVTELLWLIYNLEKQAEASGGKLHFILGNHEVMNMNGDFHYVHPRYMAHADQMKLPYLDFFSAKAELGRWVASKNIAERIGNILLAHGGFSAVMNHIEIPLGAISDTARLYYTDTGMAYPSPYSGLIFSDDGPLWYRGYYYGEQRASQKQVDSTLFFYNTRYIITGHTVVSKQIVSIYGGKVINTDVPHKLGFSEALLFEGNKMYRVNAGAEKKEVQVLQ